ncbi:MAG: Hpt domain-containing protein [Parachlamydiaceae bacterium]
MMNNNTSLNRIFAEYRASIPQKLELLETLIKEVKTAGSEEKMKELRLQVHKISGSAGMYGYTKAGEICKEFSLVLHRKTDTLNQSKTDPNWGNEFDDYIQKIREGFLYDSTNTG